MSERLKTYSQGKECEWELREEARSTEETGRKKQEGLRVGFELCHHQSCSEGSEPGHLGLIKPGGGDGPWTPPSDQNCSSVDCILK